MINPTQNSIVAGWGRTVKDPSPGAGDFINSGAFSEHLLKVALPIMDAVECKSRFPIFKDISNDRQICAGGEKGKVPSNEKGCCQRP